MDVKNYAFPKFDYTHERVLNLISKCKLLFEKIDLNTDREEEYICRESVQINLVSESEREALLLNDLFTKAITNNGCQIERFQTLYMPFGEVRNSMKKDNRHGVEVFVWEKVAHEKLTKRRCQDATCGYFHFVLQMRLQRNRYNTRYAFADELPDSCSKEELFNAVDQSLQMHSFCLLSEKANILLRLLDMIGSDDRKCKTTVDHYL